MKKKSFFCGNIKDFVVPYILILFRYVATLQMFRASCRTFRSVISGTFRSVVPS